ncbi:hypothetical protein ACQUEF_12525 [Vagococcus fluvialis]|uniref:hypothetical protein n=1 Tax=Vagococcus fluvialis TaxID=2738 RepID=UPI003D138494
MESILNQVEMVSFDFEELPIQLPQNSKKTIYELVIQSKEFKRIIIETDSENQIILDKKREN